jgi:hypothetical protein
VLGIFSIKELNWTKIYHTTFVTYLWDMTLVGVGIARWVCQINEKAKMDFFVNFKAQKHP